MMELHLLLTTKKISMFLTKFSTTVSSKTKMVTHIQMLSLTFLKDTRLDKSMLKHLEENYKILNLHQECLDFKELIMTPEDYLCVDILQGLGQLSFLLLETRIFSRLLWWWIPSIQMFQTTIIWIKLTDANGQYVHFTHHVGGLWMLLNSTILVKKKLIVPTQRWEDIVVSIIHILMKYNSWP